MVQPPKNDTERADAAQDALAESLERVHELVCEARFMLRPHRGPVAADADPPGAPAPPGRPRDEA